MRKIAGIFLLFLAPFVFTACIVQSLNPFYTKGSIIEYPQLSGEWLLLKEAGDNVSQKSIKPWSFSGDRIETSDNKGVSSVLRITYFKIDDSVFMDITADDPDETKINKWWTLHVIPVHSVCKVQIDGSRLTLIPLNYDWLAEALEKKNISLPFIKLENEDHIIFNSTSETWMSFLKKYADNNEAFSSKNEYELERLKK